jgi:hypothetical protein
MRTGLFVTAEPAALLNGIVQFWPRVEMSRSFVLSELQPILYIGLCRLEMMPSI